MLFRKALPCPKCGCTCEEYKLPTLADPTEYLGCPQCESQYDRTRTVMHLRDIKLILNSEASTWSGMYYTTAKLYCGKELVMSDTMEKIMFRIDKRKHVVEGVNHHTENKGTG